MRRYWVHGVIWYTKESCEAECKVINARLGEKETPVAVFTEADVQAWLEEYRRVCLAREYKEGVQVINGLLADLAREEIK